MPAVRGQGQWALGYREPLNANEQAKKDSSPLTVKQRIIDIYSKNGFDSIDGGDLRGRFRWYGLYTQRAQGIAGGRTASLEPEELAAPYFMLRIRIDGGQMTGEPRNGRGESPQASWVSRPAASRRSQMVGTSSMRIQWYWMFSRSVTSAVSRANSVETVPRARTASAPSRAPSERTRIMKYSASRSAGSTVAVLPPSKPSARWV